MAARDVFYRERDKITAALQKGQNPYGGYQNAVNSIYNTYGRNSGVSFQEVQGIISEAYPRDPRPSSPGGTGAAPRSAAPTGGGTAVRQAPVLNQGAVDATQKAIDSLGIERDTGYRNIDDSFRGLVSKYDNEARRNEEDYGEQTVTNTTNLSKNKQNALLAAAQGRRGLRGTLAALGALSGDGGKLADRAVTTAANQDVGEAADTYAGNAQNLDKAIGRFREEDKDRRAEAETTRVNQRTALEGQIAAKRQQFLQKMAEIFAAAERTGDANRYLGEAGNLNNEIASKTRVATAAFAPRAAAFTPGALENYLAGAGDMTVDVAEGDAGGGIGRPTSILAGRRKRRDEELVAA